MGPGKNVFEPAENVVRLASDMRHYTVLRKQPRRTARRAVIEVRDGHQPRDRQDARPRRAAGAHRPRRRSDRVNKREFISLVGGAAGQPGGAVRGADDKDCRAAEDDP